ncbi:MAG: hypothetical protein Q8M76_15285, partial [Spirochaetaceae bacterium]|nr:hypothetical protein [Spirochaetaceae bacterium]
MNPRRLALRVCANSVVMMVGIYVVMQVFAYLRDNVILGISGLAAMPAYVGSFIAFYVMPPVLLFGTALYLYARPLERMLSRLESGERIDDEAAEATRRR